MIFFSSLFSVLPSLCICILVSLHFFFKGVYRRTIWFNIVLTVLVILFSCTFIIVDGITGDGVDESVIYHFRVGFGGAGFAEYYQFFILGISSILLSLIILIFISRLPRVSFSSYLHRYGPVVGLVAALIIHPLSISIKDYLSDYLLSNYVQAESYSDWSGDFIGRIDNFEKYNLVFIYAESFERTYFDENIFPGLVRQLKEWESKAVSFTELKQAYGTGWTIAGMVASQCGLPLVTTGSLVGVGFDSNTMGSWGRFLPGANCLGDILKNSGYYLAYLGGAKSEFGGKKKFYQTHGFDEVLGFESITSSQLKSSSGWGLFDEDLFTIGIDKYNSLSSKNQPFAMFMLTLDTHHPKGHKNPKSSSIYGDGSNHMLNAVAHSDKNISKFLRQILESPYANKTIVVVASDHLAMKNEASRLLNTTNRRNLFFVLSPNVEPKTINKVGSTLDIAPTILGFLGSSNAALGLGKNLRNDSVQTIMEAFPNANSRIKIWKKDILKYWLLPNLKNGISFSSEERTLKVENQKMSFPFVAAVDADLKILRVAFPPYRNMGKFEKMFQDVPAIFSIESCSLFASLTDKELAMNDLCLYFGNRTKEKSYVVPIGEVQDKLDHELFGQYL